MSESGRQHQGLLSFLVISVHLYMCVTVMIVFTAKNDRRQSELNFFPELN